MSELAEASDTTLFSQSFDRAGVTRIRHAIADQAAAAGLRDTRLADFVLAINELVTNAVRHAGGRGHLTLARYNGVLHCEVIDDGPGIPADRVNDVRRPPALATGGRGLWLVRRLCDRVDITTGPTGTVVRIEASISPTRSP